MSGSVPIREVTECAALFGLDARTLLMLVDEAMQPAQEKIEEERRPKRRG